VKSLGADKVIDYTQEDFTKRGEVYDVIFDTVGKSPFSGSIKSLKENGFYLFTTFGLPIILRMLLLNRNSGKKVIIGLTEITHTSLNFLKDLVEEGMLNTVIDRCYPIEQSAEAHRFVETGHKNGHVVITML